MKISKWLLFDARTTEYWTAVIQSKVLSIIKGKSSTSQKGTELACHISIKLNIINFLISKIGREYNSIVNECKEHTAIHIYSTKTLTTASVFPLNENLKYNLISDIESFLFQINSCWELMNEYILILYELKGIPLCNYAWWEVILEYILSNCKNYKKNHLKKKLKVLINQLHTNQKETEWISLLDRHSASSHRTAVVPGSFSATPEILSQYKLGIAGERLKQAELARVRAERQEQERVRAEEQARMKAENERREREERERVRRTLEQQKHGHRKAHKIRTTPQPAHTAPEQRAPQPVHRSIAPIPAQRAAPTPQPLQRSPEHRAASDRTPRSAHIKNPRK